MATVLSARKTRNVRSAARLPRSIPIVTYLLLASGRVDDDDDVAVDTHGTTDTDRDGTEKIQNQTTTRKKRKEKRTTSYFDELSPLIASYVTFIYQQIK